MEKSGPIAAIIIAAVVFAVFFMTLKKTKPDQITFELIDESPAPQNLLPSSKDHKISPELLNDLIRQKPDNVGATIREWLATKSAS